MSLLFPQAGAIVGAANLLHSINRGGRSRGGQLRGLGGGLGVDPVTAIAIAQGVMAVGSVIGGWIGRRGKQKVAATQIVDEAERHLQKNLEEYRKAPPSPANQQQGIANFEAVWGQVIASCSDPQLGAAGRRCISERQRGGQWDWFARYLDPIANDPRIAELEAEAAAAAAAGPSVGFPQVFQTPAGDGFPFGMLAGLSLLTLGVLAL